MADRIKYGKHTNLYYIPSIYPNSHFAFYEDANIALQRHLKHYLRGKERLEQWINSWIAKYDS